MAEFIVTHGNLNLRVAGKLQRIPKGSTIKMDPAQAEGMIKRKFLAPVDVSEAVEIDADVDEIGDLRKQATELNIEINKQWKEDRLRKEIDTALAAK